MKLVYLNKLFYANAVNLVEIEHKQDRPYIMLLLKIEDHTFAIPLRSNIKHRFYFRTSTNELGNGKGLDYSKALIITNDDIDKSRPNISRDEFHALKGKENIIYPEFHKYIHTYKKAFYDSKKNIKDKNRLKAISMIIKYSTLQNYHLHLGITIENEISN